MRWLLVFLLVLAQPEAARFAELVCLPQPFAGLSRRLLVVVLSPVRCFHRGRRKAFGHRKPIAPPAHRSRAKPPWVVREVLYLKALMPSAGCRHVADLFNRRFASEGVSVGKTFVNETLRKHYLAMLRLRREIRRRKLKAAVPNRVWGLDLTGKTDRAGKCHAILARVDHGSRANLRLVAVPDKRAVTVLREIVKAVVQFGRPQFIRTDNEALFSLRLLNTALRLLGIGHQTIDLACPWQNGRVERFFRTLKEKLDRFSVESLSELNGALEQFRLWYNHVRPHQALAGLTPAAVWAGETSLPRFRKAYWFEAWDGLLQGFYLRR